MPKHKKKPELLLSLSKKGVKNDKEMRTTRWHLSRGIEMAKTENRKPAQNPIKTSTT